MSESASLTLCVSGLFVRGQGFLPRGVTVKRCVQPDAQPPGRLTRKPHPVRAPHSDLPSALSMLPPVRKEYCLRLGLLESDRVVVGSLQTGLGASLQLAEAACGLGRRAGEDGALSRCQEHEFERKN